ncbi:hypothetical protein LG047_08645 [Methylocystis sp. WRRC1]|nr:hypothetical protein [Methylocystis sp. WRRC1]
MESGLIEHPAAAEVAAIGEPDAIAGESVNAFFAFELGFKAGEAMRKTLLDHARWCLDAVVQGNWVPHKSVQYARSLSADR